MPDELIRFASGADNQDQVFACVLPSGLVEVSVPIEHRDGPDGPVLPLVVIAQLISRFHTEIATGAFHRIFGTSPSRVDWMLNVSPSIDRGDHQRTEWVDLDFPGRRPSGRASGMRPAVDPRGYGRAASQSLPTRVEVGLLARYLLADLLERNGFHDIDGSIDDTIDALRASEPERRAVS